MFMIKEYGFLSNFYPVEIKTELGTFNSTEAAFQAYKCPQRAKEFEGLTPDQAKHKGRHVKLRPDWEDIKLDVMEKVLRIKFSDPTLKQKLINVTEPIVEDNYWNDTFWGVCRGAGQNNLGKLLTKLQNEFKESIK